MNKKQVLFISYDGMTDPLGQSQVIPYLQGLCKKGYSFFLLSCEKKEAYNQNKETVKQLLTGYNIEWVPIWYTKKPPIVSTLYDVLKLKQKAKQLCKQYAIQMVHTRPGIPSMVGLWLKNKCGVKFLNDIREFYADSRVDGGMWNLKNPLYKFVYSSFKKRENEQLKNSDGIVCLTYAAEKIIQQSKAYQKDTPLQVIPCSVDVDLFNPANISSETKIALSTELNITANDFVVTYLGSIGGWYLTAEMMEFCKKLSDVKPNTKFLFISPHRHNEILDAAAKFGLPPNKIITKKATRNQVPALLALSSYAIFFIKPCFSKQSSSPTKHGEIMAMGIPVITNSGVGDVAEIVTKYSSGIVLDAFNDQAYEAAIAHITNYENYDASKIRHGAMEFYSLQNAIEKYANLYNKLID